MTIAALQIDYLGDAFSCEYVMTASHPFGKTQVA